jgi:uncharacterized iron-regulated protein
VFVQLFFASALLFSFARAAAAEGDRLQLFDGANLQSSSISQLTAGFSAGEILVLGEIHGVDAHHDLQVRVIENLLSSHTTCQLQLGLEFIDWTKQSAVDRFLDGLTTEAEFLLEVNWPSGNSFSDYRRQVELVRNAGGRVFGINAPRWLSRQVGRVGVSGLTEKERAMLPPDFEVGGETYRERFIEAVSGHGQHPSPSGAGPLDWLQNMFEAQSVWDDTMAHRSLEVLRANSRACLVILVGDFHVAYGGGLPDRIRRRSQSAVPVRTLSQIDARSVDAAELLRLMRPHSADGPRGDLISVFR